MAERATPLVTDEVYHIISCSIASYEVFTSDFAFDRIVKSLWYFQYVDVGLRFAKF